MELLLLILLCGYAWWWHKGAQARVHDIDRRLKAQSKALRLLEARVAALGAAGAAPQAPRPQTEEPAGDADAEAFGSDDTETAAQTAQDEPLPPPPLGPAAAPASFEEMLGTRWSVWIGGVALALGCLLLVRYSIEQGFFGPGVRVTLGLLLSTTLVGIGEWLRRSERSLAVRAIPAAHVPSVLTAAGTAGAFGTAYAAHALYGFVDAATAFVLLGAIAVATMLAAALHGPALAGLGLAGSLAVPALVSSQTPSPWPLVIYLAVVAAAAYVLARVRRWLWLVVAVVAGAVCWGLMMTGRDGVGSATWQYALFAHTALQLALASVLIALEPNRGTEPGAAAPDRVASTVLAALTMLAAVALADAAANPLATSFALLATTILTLTAWYSAPAAAAASFAGVVALARLAVWPGLQAAAEPQWISPQVAEVLRLPENVTAFLTFAAASTLALGAVATLRLWRGRALPASVAGLYALGAISPALLALMLAYLRVTQFDRSIPFAGYALALAALYSRAAGRFRTACEEQAWARGRFVAGCFAAATAASVTIACVMVLERGYLTVAFAIVALTTSFFAVSRQLDPLRYVVAALGFVVLGRLAWDPRVMGAEVGSWPILNWLLFGYGVPAVAFIGSARLLLRRAEDTASRVCDALGVVFAALLVFFEIHHALNGGDVLAPTSDHVEMGLVALMSISFAFVGLRLDLQRRNPVFRAASRLFAVGAALVVLFGLGLFENPLLAGDRIRGVPLLDSLVLAYLLPGLAAAALARAGRGVAPRWYVLGAAQLALLLLFAYVTLEVRHCFQGANIDISRAAGGAEVWSYSAAWLALGLACLAYGVLRGSREARLASAALVVLSVLKVGLYDLTGIEGLWRALSFLVLGAVLIGIGSVYQRLIFAQPKDE